MSTFDLEGVFSEPTHLHLVCWNLFDVDRHKAGLLFLRDLFFNSDLAKKVMPMIRPLGRANLDFYDGAQEHYGDTGTPGSDYEIFSSGDTSHCEVWIQTSAISEAEVWIQIVKWIDTIKHGFARRSVDNPLWHPFSCDLSDAGNYYPRHRTELDSKAYPKVLEVLVTKSRIPWFLKLVWSRATRPILANVVQNDQVVLVDPTVNSQFFKKLLLEVVSEFDLADYDMSSVSRVVDPKPFGISHMPAFAVNATTSTRPKYQLEQHYDRRVTHPYS